MRLPEAGRQSDKAEKTDRGVGSSAMPGLERELLVTLSTGIVELPPMGNRDDLAVGALKTYLKRRELWQQLRKDAPGRLSAYPVCPSEQLQP